MNLEKYRLLLSTQSHVLHQTSHSSRQRRRRVAVLQCHALLDLLEQLPPLDLVRVIGLGLGLGLGSGLGSGLGLGLGSGLGLGLGLGLGCPPWTKALASAFCLRMARAWLG